MMRLAVAVIALAGGLACDNGESTPDWSRMITQPKLLPYGTSELFADHRAMRPLPAGTVPRERIGEARSWGLGTAQPAGPPTGARSSPVGSIPDPARGTGGDGDLDRRSRIAGGGDPDGSAGGSPYRGANLPRGIDRVPLPITRALLERGRERFAIVCATCHGVAGDGDSAVAHHMQRRRPPSLHEPRIVALPPGAMYRVITAGYGVMPSYAKLLGPDDRWAVVAYVRTLELSWTAPLDALPAALRDDLARRLR